MLVCVVVTCAMALPGGKCYFVIQYIGYEGFFFSGEYILGRLVCAGDGAYY